MIDTQAERISLIGLNMPVPSLFPLPDGTIIYEDRRHFLWLFANLYPIRRAIRVIAKLYGRAMPVYLFNRDLSISLYNRSV